MSVLKVLTEPDPRLHRKAQPVAQVDGEIRQLMDDMVETMHAEDGVGLAAIQVGVEKRVVVINVDSTADDPGTTYKMANPEIIWIAENKVDSQEGCLSVPDVWAPVKRATKVRVTYLDENNQSQQLEAEGLLAYCIQHEIDHLNGVLFIEHLSRLKRELILQRLRKRKLRS